jgi:hypothetical protein
VKEIETAELRAKLGEQIVIKAGADFNAPLIAEESKIHPHHSGARAKAREPGLQRRGSRPPLDFGPHTGAHDRNDRKKRRRDRSGGPRPSRPRPK